jgi:hypothetical protein
MVNIISRYIEERAVVARQPVQPGPRLPVLFQ